MDTPDLRPTAALLDEGWTPRRIAAAVADGTFERVRRGNYSISNQLDTTGKHLLRLGAACNNRSPDHVVSHISAAVLHGLPVRHAALE